MASICSINPRKARIAKLNVGGLADQGLSYVQMVCEVVKEVSARNGWPELACDFYDNLWARHQRGDMPLDWWVALGEETSLLEEWEKSLLAALQAAHKKWCHEHGQDPAMFFLNAVSMDPQTLAECLEVRRERKAKPPDEPRAL